MYILKLNESNQNIVQFNYIINIYNIIDNKFYTYSKKIVQQTDFE